MADLSSVLTRAGYTAWVYDAPHGRIDIVTGDGHLYGWSLSQQAYTLDLTIGGTPNTLDITQDGKFLIAGNKEVAISGSTASSVFERTNLDTQVVNTLQFAEGGASQRGLLDLAIGQDGAVYYDRQSGQFGTASVETFQAAAATPTGQGAVGLSDAAFLSFIERSDDGHYLLIGDPLGGSQMLIYDTLAHQVTARGPRGPTPGHGDITAQAGGLAVEGLVVYDLNLHVVKDLSSVIQNSFRVLNSTFSDDGHQLFVWRASIEAAFGPSPSTVLVFDTQSWTQVGSFDLTLATPIMSITGARPAAANMQVAGNVLVLDNGSQIELADLSARAKLTVTGDASDQTLWGGVGTDSLSGGGGSDVLAGGGGSDTLSGGAGIDTFTFAAGDSPTAAGQGDVITDWQAGEGLRFGQSAGAAANYAETTAGSFASALSAANGMIAGGAVDYVAVAVGGDVVVFADSRGDNGAADDAVTLTGRGLADIGFENILGAGPLTGGALPPPSQPPAGVLKMFVTGNMDAANLSDLLPAVLTDATTTRLLINGANNLSLDVGGAGFTYLNDQLVAGDVTTIFFNDAPANLIFQSQGIHLGAQLLTPWLIANSTALAFQTIMAGADLVSGSSRADLIHSYAGNDLLYGNGGGDSLFGGLGDDIIYAQRPPTIDSGAPVGPAGATYLRGEEGDDYIIGGDGFDDANGNMGADTISTGAGDDYSVGGKDNDLLFGDAGNDIVWGNLGADTCDGGDGADQVRGGQGDDSVSGGAGNDFVSGDRGNDTESGGAGADIFHGSQDAGIDRVLDFKLSEGDRVQLDPGTTFTTSQVGADTVIDMGGGNQMILVGVSMSTLTGNWIFGA